MHLCIYVCLYVYDRVRLILRPALSPLPQTSKGCVPYLNEIIYAFIYSYIYLYMHLCI